MSVIIPNICADSKDMKGPLFFLGGPDQGGGDWRLKVYNLLAKKFGENFCAAVPCRYSNDHPFMSRRLPSNGHFPRRLPWVRFYSTEAGVIRPQGCTLYYFPVESTAEPRTDGIAYATKSIFEIGEWLGRMQYDPRKMRFVLGMEPQFPGRDGIVRNFDKALRGHFKVHDSLEETVDAAIKRTSNDDWFY